MRLPDSMWRRLVPLATVLAAACATVPYTNRSQLMLMSRGEEAELGAAAYRQALKTEKIVESGPAAEVVRRVGERIARAAERADFRWEFKLIDNDEVVNAFCLPGGKVAIYSGIFPVAYDEAGLAAVMGHEVAHALARHGAERMSQGQLAQIGAIGVAVAVGDQSPATQQAVMSAFGIGTQVGVLLPFSRAHEAEADHIGMILMAKAGYDPAAALQLWQRMEQMERRKRDGGTPEFLSTHPGYQTRQANIEGWLAEARRHYRPDSSVSAGPLPGVTPLPAAAAPR